MSENNKEEIVEFGTVEMPNVTMNNNLNNTHILKNNYINTINNSNNSNTNDMYTKNIKKPIIEFDTIPEDYIINIPSIQSPEQINNDIESNIIELHNDIDAAHNPPTGSASDPYGVYVHNLCSQNVEEQINNCLDYIEHFFISCVDFTKNVYNDICIHSDRNTL